MGEIERLLRAIQESRAELLAAVDGVSREAFLRQPPEGASGTGERWSIRDVLWHVGYMEDWRRRVISAGLEGRELPSLEHRRRPAYLDSPELLIEWLAQSRRPVRSLLGRIAEVDLAREIPLAGGEQTTPRAQIEAIAEHDREHAAQVHALRAPPAARDPERA